MGDNTHFASAFGPVVSGLVSIIVLSYNRKEEILGCLESLEAQTYRHREIIVLENASNDGSREALESQKDRINLVQMSRNHGDWEGRDIALQECRGEFVIIVDNDAIVDPDCIEKLVAALRGNGKLGCVQPKIIDPKTGIAYNPGFGREHADTRHYKAVFHGCVTLFRAKALREAGGFPHYLLGGAEDYISLRFYELGYDVLYEPSVVIQHLMSPRERTPYFRLQQQSRQKMRAKMTLAPDLLWFLAIFLRAMAAFAFHAIKRGYLFRIPRGLCAHFVSGWLALRERAPISHNAFRRYSDLKKTLHAVPRP